MSPGSTEPTPSDRELVGRVVEEGDEAAFRMLFRRHTPALFRFALRLTGGRQADAEDLLQEAWSRAATGLGGFEWRSSLRSWLSGILVRCSHEAHRRAKPGTDALPPASTTPPPDVVALTDLRSAFERMPEGYRKVVALAAEGFKHQEIADLLGIAPGTSKSQLARGRAWLRAALEADG